MNFFFLLAFLFVSLCSCEVIWKHTETAAVYEDVRYVKPHNILAATKSNPPPTAQYFDVDSPTPEWSLGNKPPANLEINTDSAASRAGDRVAVAVGSYNINDPYEQYANLTLYKIEDGKEPKARWSFQVPGYCEVWTNDAVAFGGHDDSLLLFFVTRIVNNVRQPRLYLFHVASSSPLYHHDFVSTEVSEDMEVSLDGSFALLNTGKNLYIFDIVNKAILFHDIVSKKTTPMYMSISDDCRTAIYGYEIAHVMKKEGNTFKSVQNITNPGFVLTQAIISKDNHYLYVGWVDFRSSFIRIDIYELFATKPVYSYRTPQKLGKYQNWVSALKVSDDGRWAIVGCAGNTKGLHAPTVLVLEKQMGFVYNYTTQGTVFSIDLLYDSQMTDYLKFVTAGGTHHHDENKKGGEIVQFRYVNENRNKKQKK
ncbi:hypothetical protein M0813_16471 [Anaeramoeba flamelloides]|uniref:Uncharacterized protein n=1 Tax=Anaeramoeba flamelloides TaxID=1746091 RepID=A0ABQ8YZ74_9EUKA|nr:hypothetical protein M0813_16471 [Anaeramoeba flamelloides]